MLFGRMQQYPSSIRFSKAKSYLGAIKSFVFSNGDPGQVSCIIFFTTHKQEQSMELKEQGSTIMSHTSVTLRFSICISIQTKGV